MENITPKLLEKIQKVFQNRFDKSEKIAKLYAKIRDGTATYIEAHQFAIEVGEILAFAFEKEISSSILPDGKMHYNIAKEILNETLGNNFKLITEVTEKVQESLNHANKIGIKAIIPEIDQENIDSLINKISVADSYDDVKWILNDPVVNFSQSVVDSSIRANAKFQFEAGLSPKIIRISERKCCKWCSDLAGVYDYSEVMNAGNDVYRRHNNCRCITTYQCGKNRQDVWSKKQWMNNFEDSENRKSFGKELTKLSQTEAAKKEQDLKKLQKKKK